MNNLKKIDKYYSSYMYENMDIKNFIRFCNFENIVIKKNNKIYYVEKLNFINLNTIQDVCIFLVKKYNVYINDNIISNYNTILFSFNEFLKNSKLLEIPTSVKLDYNVDTSDTEYIETLPFNSYELECIFGNPKKINLSQFEYEWKITINNRIYSIYDFIDDDDTPYELREWHIASLNSNHQCKDIRFLYKYINNFLQKSQKPEKSEKSQKPEKPEKSQKPEKPEKSQKPEKPEKSQKPENYDSDNEIDEEDEKRFHDFLNSL